MMIRTIQLYVGVIWTSLISALVLLPPQPVLLQPNAQSDSVPQLSNNITAHTGANASLLSTLSGAGLDRVHNTSKSNLNLSAPPVIYCDEGYGVDLNVRMCDDALASIPAVIGPDTSPRSFGPREANRFDIGLPMRYMSSDGTCGIEPYLAPGRTSALVAPRLVRVAAGFLVQSCVGGEPSTGGEVRNFGGDNNLIVSVTEFDPSIWSEYVECYGSTGGHGIVDSCNNLADQMDTSKERKHFGPANLPHDYLTPYTIHDGPCYMKITSHPSNRHSILGTWYEIWEAAIMVNAMCIRVGKKGFFRIDSFDEEDQWLELEVGDLRTGDNLTLPLTTA